MQLANGLPQTVHERRKRCPEHVASCDHHIIVCRLEDEVRACPNRFPQPTLDPVALDSCADLLGHREADARPACLRPGARNPLDGKQCCVAFSARRRTQKIRPLLQPFGWKFGRILDRRRRNALFAPHARYRHSGGTTFDVLRPTSACDHARGAPQSRCGHPPSPCARGNHDGAFARSCWAERCVSRRLLRFDGPAGLIVD